MSILEPSKITIPFADSGLKNVIPQTSNNTTGKAGFDKGFPERTMLPKASGGIPPSGMDFNGILFDVTAAIRYMQAGGKPTYDAAFAAAIGGYPSGAVLIGDDGVSVFQNAVAGNETDPNSGGAGWTRPDLQMMELYRRSYAEAGYNLADGSFEAGGTLTSANDVLLHKASGKAYSWAGSFPKVVNAGSTPATSGGIGAGAWLSVGDAVLRSQISDPDGIKFIGEAANIAQLRTIVGSQQGQRITVVEHTSGLLGGGLFRWDALSNVDDDNGVIIKPTSVTVGRWVRQYTLLSLYDFGAVNGQDMTTVCLAAISSPQVEVIKIPDNCVLGKIEIPSKPSLKIVGGRNITLSGNGAGFYAIGTMNKLEVTGFDNITGSGNILEQQCFIVLSGNANIGFYEVHHNSASNVMVGIGAQITTGRSVGRLRFYKNTLSNIVGTASGQGYGIHAADYSFTTDIEISDNTIDRAQRHSIYCAMGSNQRILNNKIINHRLGVANTNPYPGLAIGRSYGTVADGNQFIDCWDSSIVVNYDLNNPTLIMYDIVVSNTKIVNPKNITSAINIGGPVGQAAGVIRDVVISGVKFISNQVSAPIITLYNGDDVTIDDIHGWYHNLAAGSTTNAVTISIPDSSFAQRAVVKSVKVNGNGSNVRLLRLQGDGILLANNPILFQDNEVVQSTGQTFSFSAVSTNVLIRAVNQKIDGWSLSSAVQLPQESPGCVGYGPSARRPTNGLYIGYQYFDTTIGKMITWKGTAWVDGAGTVVT